MFPTDLTQGKVVSVRKTPSGEYVLFVVGPQDDDVWDIVTYRALGAGRAVAYWRPGYGRIWREYYRKGFVEAYAPKAGESAKDVFLSHAPDVSRGKFADPAQQLFYDDALWQARRLFDHRKEFGWAK